MPFLTVRATGMLEGKPRILSDGTAFMLLADASGSLPVFVEQATPASLPAAGSWITVEGILGMASGSGAGMRVSDPGKVEVLDAPPPIQVQGQVLEVSAPSADSRAPYRIVLARPEGRLDLIHWFTPEQQVAVGDRMVAEGALGFYRGRMQVKVRSPDNLRLAARKENEAVNSHK